MAPSVQLLIIDPQNDFCDLPQSWRPCDPLDGAEITPKLPVTGAHQDMCKLAKLIQESGTAFDKITVTLDSHHRFDIAHPPFWHDLSGGEVPPFTTITASQVRAGAYRPRDPSTLARTLTYLDTLEESGRYNLMIWPIHCEIGSFGHNVHAAVKQACNQWEERKLGAVNYVYKGSNPWTEHYSALMAEVVDPTDPHTQLNNELLAVLDQADLILIAGEASSHCVRATTEHLADHIPSGRLERVLLLSDCMSPVPGFEAQAQSFLDNMRARGMKLAESAHALTLLARNH